MAGTRVVPGEHDASRDLLEQWVTEGSASQRLRAMIILERSRGASLTAIAARLGVHRDTVRRWLTRYRRQGIAGLAHRNAGRRRPRLFDTTVRDAIRQTASTPPRWLGEPFEQWSLYKLRRYLLRTGLLPHISIERLRQIVAETGGRPACWRPPFPDSVSVDAEARRQLTLLTQDPMFATRAAIVLQAAQGDPVKAIAVDLGTSSNTARRWIRRFVAGGVDALQSAPVRGQPVTFNASVCERIIAAAACSPLTAGVGRPRWSLGSLRQHLIEQGIVSSISIEWLRQILRRAEADGRSGRPLPGAARSSARRRRVHDASLRETSSSVRVVREPAARTPVARPGREFGAPAVGVLPLARSRTRPRPAEDSAR